MNILILGGGLQALSCGASLYKLNYTIDVISNDSQIIRSRYFNKVYKSVDGVSSELYDVLKSVHYQVIIPMGDKYVSFLSKNKIYIENQFNSKCACVDYDLLKLVEDKHSFMEFCANNEIPHPRTMALTEKSLELSSKFVGFPALIKPNFSVGARGIVRVDSFDELVSKYANIHRQYGDCTLQELVINDEYYYNVMLYRSKNGSFIASTIIKIVRKYPIDAGSSSCCISVVNDELLNICKSCLNKLNWYGIADFDVLQDLTTNEYKIIEINPRVPASLKAAAVSGINFPEIIVKDCVGKEMIEYTYNPGMTLRYLGLDIMWFLKSKSKLKTRPSWFKFIGRNIYYQDIYQEDSSTWWTWLAEGIKKIKRKNQRIR